MPPSRRISRLTADIALLDERLVEIVATNAAVIHRYQTAHLHAGYRRRARLHAGCVLARARRQTRQFDPPIVRRTASVASPWMRPHAALAVRPPSVNCEKN